MVDDLGDPDQLGSGVAMSRMSYAAKKKDQRCSKKPMQKVAPP